MEKPKLLLVEQDSSTKFFVKNFFETRNFCIEVCNSFTEVLNLPRQNNYDVAIVDTQNSFVGAISSLKRIKEKLFSCPVIMFADYSNETSVIEIYKNGANILHPKPINYKVLEVQVNSLVKTTQVAKLIEVADIFISPKARICIKNNKEIYLTLNEFNLLCLLFSNTNKIFSRQEILSKVLDDSCTFGAVDTLVSRLRSKLGLYKNKNCIETVVKSGFRLISDYRIH